MTNDEALEIIKLAISEIEWNYPLDYAIAFEKAIAALEKQIPKKPKDDGWLYCPDCGTDVLQGKYTYCPDCGQKIDWDERK